MYTAALIINCLFPLHVFKPCPKFNFENFFLLKRLRMAIVQDMGPGLCDAMLMVTRALLTVTPVS